jgi:twitching motility protein PilJ
LFSVVKNNVIEILNNTPQLFKLHQAALEIQFLRPRMLAASDQLAGKISGKDADLRIMTLAGYGFGILTLIFLALLATALTRRSQRSLLESQEQNDRNQRAILRLLDEMANLADGDLSTHTTVTEDITGAIADSVNYSIDALRDLVETINKTAAQVGNAVNKTRGTTEQLEKASISQAKEISAASAAITEISRSMTNISAKAGDSAEVARKSVGIAHNGGETVRQTISGMETIREQIQETSKRIKRLGESSQEIGDIVNLITEISDQTNILALNAAIQASMAGEAGRGFAVVADEVQRLAERTGDATKQIEALVKAIQADTKEAAVSMEQSTANVVKGARLTEKAGGALDQIEQVSMNLAQRILEISDSTKSQATASIKITEAMGVIQEITLKTSEGSGQVSGSIGILSSMVEAMHKSVAGFKLPGTVSADSTFIQNPDQSGALDSKAE